MRVLNTFLGLSTKFLQKLQQSYDSEAKNALAESVCHKSDIKEAMRMRNVETTPHVFSHKVRENSDKSGIIYDDRVLLFRFQTKRSR